MFYQLLSTGNSNMSSLQQQPSCFHGELLPRGELTETKDR